MLKGNRKAHLDAGDTPHNELVLRSVHLVNLALPAISIFCSRFARKYVLVRRME